MVYNNLAILDVETTGATAPFDRIIEIGILRIENGKITRKFETLLNPEVALSPFIEDLTGIRNNDLLNAPTFQEIRNDVIEMIEDCVFVAHNARFDYSFIKNEFKRIGIPYSAKQLCTVKLSRLLFPEFTHHNLDSIMERFEITCERRHRALDDARVVWDFLEKLPKVIPTEKLQNAYDTVLKKPSLPPNLSKEQVESLPEKSGVYLLYGKSELPLYIGKSVNIKERVLSHFLQDTESPRELEISQQVERIESIVTAGEFSALILESELIKKLQPLYNRKLRYARQMTFVKKNQNSDGYFSVSIKTGQIKTTEMEDVLGIFKSQKAAKEFLSNLSKEHSLCEKLLGLQKISGPCFAYHLGICKGACANKENAQIFNARFIVAFSKTKLRTWPFNGPILIKEGDEELTEAMVFDKWCYLGKYSEFSFSDDTDTTLLSDYDSYKLLNSFLKNPRNLKKIQSLKNAGPEDRSQLSIL